MWTTDDGRHLTPSLGVRGGGAMDDGTMAFATVVVSAPPPPLLRRRRGAGSALAAFSSSSSAAAAASATGGSAAVAPALAVYRPVPRPDEPDLFDIPPDLHSAYRPVPVLLRAAIAAASALLAADRRRLRSLFLLDPPAATTVSISRILRGAAALLLRTALLWKIAELAVQERYFPPVRASTASLSEGGRLPSSLSRYAVVTPLPMTMGATTSGAGGGGGEGEEVVATTTTTTSPATTIPIGVHYLQYDRRRRPTTASGTGTVGGSPRWRRYDYLSLHHGFGASSLSWLPALPPLVEMLGSSRGVAHDAPGFGFTDRPDGDEGGRPGGGLVQYGSECSAGIGLALLLAGSSPPGRGEEAAPATGDSGGDAPAADGGGGMRRARSIAVFGHSMGARAALITALRCASDPGMLPRPDLVVLVAPALVGVTLPSARRRRRGSSARASVAVDDLANRSRGGISRVVKSVAGGVWVKCRSVFVDYPLRYGLRRLVCGTRDFWRKGLTLAWGDPGRLSDSDVLRFQWPSVGEGWEQGLLNFSRSRILSSHSPNSLDDGRLFREVASMADTRVVIIYGSKDRVVRIDDGAAEALRREFPNVRVIKMEGCGHDPFEEDVPGFLTVLAKALEGE